MNTLKLRKVLVLALMIGLYSCQNPQGGGEVPVPGQPTGLVATVGIGSVEVGWDLVGGADSYTLFWSLDPQMSDANVHTIQKVKPVFKHEFLDVGATYYYKVAAVNSGGMSKLSGSVSGSLPFLVPTVPAGVEASLVSETSISLKWQPTAGAKGYNVYWSYSPNMNSSNWKVFLDVKATEFLHSGLEAGSTFYYSVAAVNAAGESPLSATVSASTGSTK